MKFIVLFSSALLVAELSLRLLGLHNLPNYDRSEDYEYCMKPNQDCTILKKKLTTNLLGLRGELPSKKSEAVVWYCGDSVIHGGVHTDDDSLATTI